MISNVYSFCAKKCRSAFPLIASAILVLLTLVGCGPSTEELLAIDYTPLPVDDREVSTPAEQGLDPMLVMESRKGDHQSGGRVNQLLTE